MEKICPFHKTALVNRKGVSRSTGKPYNFWGCPSKDGEQFCKYTENERSAGAAYQAKAPVAEDVQTRFMKLVMDKLTVIEEKVTAIAEKLDPPGGSVAGF